MNTVRAILILFSFAFLLSCSGDLIEIGVVPQPRQAEIPGTLGQAGTPEPPKTPEPPRIVPTCDDPSYTAISDEAGLRAIASNLGGNYCLTTDLTLTGYHTPIGTRKKPFTGIFIGVLDEEKKKTTTISNLRINNEIASSQGLFARIGDKGIVKNLTIKNPSVNANGWIGALAGVNEGTIENVKVTAKDTDIIVSGTGNSTGGLVGINYGTITSSHVKGSVMGRSYTGGLVGQNWDATITSSTYEGGTVTGTEDGTGGLVGYNSLLSTITSSRAVGSVRGTTNTGGLVGINYGTITNSYAVGTVMGITHTGGLVGWNARHSGSSGGTIENSYFDPSSNPGLPYIGRDDNNQPPPKGYTRDQS